MAVMVPVALWMDGTEGGRYMRFTESWRSVKTDGWGISRAGTDGNPDKLNAALKLIDFAYTDKGMILMSYGPDAFIKTNPDGSYATFLFNGQEMPEIADATYQELWDKANGNYTNYARMYLGSTLSFAKSQAFEYQCTHEVGKEGALGMMTDLYDTLYSTMMNASDLTQTDVPGSVVYYNMQEFNGAFLNFSIILILPACLLYVTNTHIRRRYYIGNYFAIAAFAGRNANLALWSHGYFEIFKRQFLEVDFAALRVHADLWKTAYTESAFWFDAHYDVFAVTTLVSVLLILNALWKIGLMSAEARLIRKGKEAAA